MPFKSESQRRFLWAKHPDIARRWSKKYGTPVHLPQRKIAMKEDINPLHKFAVSQSGGSIGETGIRTRGGKKIVFTHDDPDVTRRKAVGFNAQLSPGEKKILWY